MTAQELQALVAAAMRDAGGEPKEWDLHPGDEDCLVGPDGLAQWLAVLDDRTPGSDGLFTFDSPEFDKMLGATILVVVDYAPEPDAGVYELLGHWVACGSRVLVIQTIECRRKDWHGYLSAFCKEDDIAEIVPVENAPEVSGRLRITSSCCPKPGRRQTASSMDQSQQAEWNTPWGPAFRLTRIAAGIEFFETATVSCYRLTPVRNAEVPDTWRDVATSGHAQEGWYSEKDAALVMLAFPSYFGADELLAAAHISHSLCTGNRCPRRERSPMTELLASSFDYGQLDGDTAAEIQEAAVRVRGFTRAAVIEVGRELLRIRQHLNHGQFTTWVENACQLTMRTAQRATRAADMVEKNDKLSYLPPDGLTTLAEKSAPQAAVAAVIEEIEVGGRPSAADIRWRLRDARRTSNAATKARKSAALNPILRA